MESGISTALAPATRITDRHLALWLFFAPAALLLMAILALNGGTLIYTLDDPYIHLALARQIFSGHYGINPGEFSAPSSSIIWPFLLAPFAMLGHAMLLVPLVLNLVFSYFTFMQLARLLDRVRLPYKAIILGGWMLATNFYGLIFNGMEHCLQVLLVVVIARAVLDKEFRNQTMPLAGYAALALLPMVRYEGLAVSMPVLLYLLLKGEGGKPLVCGVLIVALVASFSMFLQHIGVGWLPSSVIAKSDTSGLKSLGLNAINQFEKYGWVIVAMLVMCAFFIQRRALVLMLVCVTVLHVLLGKNGWYGRYEIYWLNFLGVFFLYWAVTHLHERSAAMIFGALPLAFAPLVYTTLSTPLASQAIHNQQYPMAMIAKALDAPVAVNDLGLVALNSNHYVLDLWGLGSLEALKMRKADNGSGWIKSLMDSKDVHYAFVYDEWFPDRPANWVKVADLSLNVPKIAAAFSSVAMYATDTPSADKLESTLKAYQAEHPGARFSVHYERL